jgi:GT2 family glycosyltransferase
MTNPPDLSICIVALNAREYLRACLQSILQGSWRALLEISVVDNHSSDDSLEMLAKEFPGVQVIRNHRNDGFSKPANLAIKASRGRYILLLNPDTLVHEASLDNLVQFLETEPGVGIVGPKILNGDGTLQKRCRRSEGRPWDAFCHLSGLARMFPQDRRFNGYLMSYLDEDEIHEVQAVSGACMLVRREVFDKVGLLDERFFAYQEDSDLCMRARQAGWRVCYLPTARVTHFGGKGGAGVHPYHSLMEWHLSYYRYYRKHFADETFFLENWFIYFLIVLKFTASFVTNLFRREKSIGSRRE